MGRRKMSTTTFNNETGEVLAEEEEMLPGPGGHVFAVDDDEDIRRSPVTNEQYLPLFPDADKDPTHNVAVMRVYKTAPIGDDGYKGELPAEANEEAIWRSWGDGTYRLVGVNGEGREVRKNPNLVISKGPRTAQNGGGNATQLSGDAALVQSTLDKVLETVKTQIAASKEDRDIAVSQVRKQHESFTEVISGQSKQTTELLAKHYESGGASQRDFFASMMQMQQQMHQMQMQMVMAMNAQSMQQNNPQLLIATLMQGLQLGAQMGGGDDEDDDPALRMLEVGAGALNDLKEMATGGFKPKKKAHVTVRQPAAPQIPGMPSAPQLAKPQQGAPAANAPKERRFSPDQAKKLALMKEIADKKDLDFDDLLDQALGWVANVSPEEADAASDEASDTAEAGGSDDGTNGVHGDEPQDTSAAT